MGHERFVEPLSLGSLTMALLASGLLACPVVDDDVPPSGVGDTGSNMDVCLAQLETAEAVCQPGMHFESMFEGGGSLLARVGLERGDIILGVDGESMHGADRVLAKAMDAFMGGRPTSELELVVLRGTKTIDTVVRIR